jgi:general secretion pathway protein A
VFLKFFGLKEQPFGVTPDPRYLYLSPAHREALASLFYGIEVGRGFLAVIAKPGMGKTTLLFHLLEKFRTSARTAFLFQTQCTSREFMRFLLAELGCETADHDFVRMHEEFNRLLLREARAGNRFIVVIDEAQNLTPSVLETIRLLSDFETPRAKLLQIVLAGQPELADKLVSANLAQLRQRISITSSLKPLTLEETKGYIEHRMKIAGYAGLDLFTPEALLTTAEFTEGIPRNINNFCFNAMSLACSLRRPVIDGEIVQEVIADLDIYQHTSQPADRLSPRTVSVGEAEEVDYESPATQETIHRKAAEIRAEPFWDKSGKDKSLTPDEARAYLEQFMRWPRSRQG